MLKKTEKNNISFSFGRNWSDYVNTVDDQSIRSAQSDITNWLQMDNFSNKSILDIGCGSGIHSLCFHLMQAGRLVSFDFDPKSVEATVFLQNKYGQKTNWKILEGSILNKKFLTSLGTFDIVYSWGVFHHTGQMWQSIENAFSLIGQGGYLWFSLYTKGPNYQRDLKLKQKFNKSSLIIKKKMIYERILNVMFQRYKKGKNPFQWNEKVSRGMDTYHDLIDWLGGLPYEVASKEEVIEFCSRKGNMKMVKIQEAPETSCTVYLFQKSMSCAE